MVDDATWQEFIDQGCILQSASDWWSAEALAECTREGEAFVELVQSDPTQYLSRVKAYMRYSDADPSISQTLLMRMSQALQPFAERVDGSKVFCHTARYIVTLPSTAAPTYSQRWHRDPEGAPVLKVFLHLRAVDTCHGPFEYVPGTSRNRKPELCQPEGREPKNVTWTMPSWLTCTGPAGMVALADTSGIHRGGMVTTGLRLQAMWMFLAPGQPRHAGRTFYI